MLVKAYKIVTVNDSGRRYNTIALFAYDPSEIVTVENVSSDYLGQYDEACRVTFKNGESAILRCSVAEVMEEVNG